MNTEQLTKWVAALRSGNYQQAQCLLRVNKEDGQIGYCCLGVYLDLQGAEWRGHEGRPYMDYDCTIDGGFVIESNAPPSVLQRHIDLSDDELNHLIDLNDRNIEILLEVGSRPATFNDIADWIEKNIKPDDAPTT